MPIDPVSTGIEAAEGLFKIGAGLIGGNKAKKEGDALRKTRPVASLNPELRNNLGLAESELAGNDLSSWKQLSDSDLSASLGAMLKGGGTPNDVGSVFANNEQGRLKMMQFQEQLRQQKIANLSAAETDEATDQMRVFDFNSRQWFDDAQANAVKKQQSASLLGGGLSDIGALGSKLGTESFTASQTDKTLQAQKDMYNNQEENFMSRMNEYMNPQSMGGVRS